MPEPYGSPTWDLLKGRSQILALFRNPAAQGAKARRACVASRLRRGLRMMVAIGAKAFMSPPIFTPTRTWSRSASTSNCTFPQWQPPRYVLFMAYDVSECHNALAQPRPWRRGSGGGDVDWSALLDAICILLLQNYQCDPAEYGHGRQYQAQGYGFPEEKDATHGRNDRNTELHCRGAGCFQRRQCCVPNGVPYCGSQCTRRSRVPKSSAIRGSAFMHQYAQCRRERNSAQEIPRRYLDGIARTFPAQRIDAPCNPGAQHQ